MDQCGSIDVASYGHDVRYQFHASRLVGFGQIIIWGATAKYVAEDTDIQTRIKMAMHAGVKFSACISCAENLGAKEKMENLGIEVIPWGKPLTRILSSEEPLLTV